MMRNGAFLEWQCRYLLQVVRYSLNQKPEIKIGLGLGLGLDGYFPILYFKFKRHFLKFCKIACPELTLTKGSKWAER